jgi:hypothetical protein
MVLLMDKETHRVVQYLLIHGSANDLDVYMLGIHNISSTIKEALKHGYEIKKKHSGVLWNRKTTYHMERNK